LSWCRSRSCRSISGSADALSLRSLSAACTYYDAH
jgi:hypothetical protein